MGPGTTRQWPALAAPSEFQPDVWPRLNTFGGRVSSPRCLGRIGLNSGCWVYAGWRWPLVGLRRGLARERDRSLESLAEPGVRRHLPACADSGPYLGRRWSIAVVLLASVKFQMWRPSTQQPRLANSGLGTLGHTAGSRWQAPVSADSKHELDFRSDRARFGGVLPGHGALDQLRRLAFCAPHVGEIALICRGVTCGCVRHGVASGNHLYTP